MEQVKTFTGQPTVVNYFGSCRVDPRSRIVAAASSKCVDLADGNSADGTPVQIWESWFLSPNQTWEAQQV